jgi:hypothetical protein
MVRDPDVNYIADRVRHGFAAVTEKLAAVQYGLAELAGPAWMPNAPRSPRR